MSIAMNAKLILSATLLTIFTSFTAFATGGMTSSGGDSKSISSDSSWFLGNAPIGYCIEVAAEQSVNETQVDQAFKFAIQTWKDYIVENFSYSQRDREHNFNFFKTNCSSTNVLLRIYVGIKNAEVDKAISLYEKPYALSYRTSYDIKSGMGAGFIWFAPDALGNNIFPRWGNPYNLQGMMLHEVGHMLGCEHVERTIMDKDIIPKLQYASSDDANWSAYGKFFLSRIDHHSFLMSSREKLFDVKGQINAYIEDESARLFELLTSRKSKGTIIANVIRTKDKFMYKIKDTIGEVSFDILLPLTNAASFSNSRVLFKKAYIDTANSNSQTATWTSSSGYSILTMIKSKSGKEYPIQVNIDSSDIGWPIVMKIQDSGPLMKSLFHSDMWVTAGLPR